LTVEVAFKGLYRSLFPSLRFKAPEASLAFDMTSLFAGFAAGVGSLGVSRSWCA